MHKLIFALALLAPALARADSMSFTTSAAWNLGGTSTCCTTFTFPGFSYSGSTFTGTSQEGFNLDFPIDQLPSGSVVTGATIQLFQTTLLDGPGGTTACAPASGFQDGTSFTGWGSVNWCTSSGFANYVNRFNISTPFPGFYASSGAYDYFSIAASDADAALLAHSNPLSFYLSVSLDSGFVGYDSGPSPPFPPFDAPRPDYSNSAVGHADLTLNVTYTMAEAGPALLSLDAPVSAVPEPSFFALIGLVLAAMGSASHRERFRPFR